MTMRCPFRRRDRAVSALEFALVTPVVLLIMMGIADYGNALQQSLRLEAAARAGAQVALTQPGDTRTTPNDPSAALVRTAVLSSLAGWAVAPSCTNGAGTGVCVSYVSWCQCPGAVSPTSPTAHDCSSDTPPCDETAQRFASISVTRNYSPLLLVPVRTLRGNVEVRTR